MNFSGKSQGHIGLFGRLLRDHSANVLAITAAAAIPMVLLAGSAIDISRVYLTKNRLQAACDSGVLAGRKAMTTLTYSTAAQTRAQAMFDFNFNDADYKSTSTTFTATADAEGKLTGTAATTLPMLVMDFVGFDDEHLSLHCSADIQVPNIDIVFVLDVTGSMDETIGGTKKIASLKTATIGFYDTIAAAMAGNTRTRVRYAFVPYSQAVNASEVFVASPNVTDYGQAPRSHFMATMPVQSRVANFTTAVTNNGYTAWAASTATPVTFDQTMSTTVAASKQPDAATSASGTKISNNDCDNYSTNLSFSIDTNPVVNVWLPTRTSWPGSAAVGDSILYKPGGTNTTWQNTVPTTGTTYTKATFARVSATWTDNSGATVANYKTCIRRVTHTIYNRSTIPTKYSFTNWTYQPVNYDVTNFAAGTAISYVSAIANTATVATSGAYTPVQLAQLTDQTGMTTSTTSWNGCLEERTTTAASSFSPIPDAAKDLDYVTGGTSDTLRWRPMVQPLTYVRAGSANETSTSDKANPGNACPSASMRNLREYSNRTNFTTYVNSLTPAGNTYLDVGMVWGLRFVAPQGMWSSRNLTGPNGGQISRHIIFLTDGAPVSSPTSYTAYGTEQMDKRITGSTGVAAATLHAARFQALCDAERGRVGIWAIAFGTSVTGNMQNCADSGRAMQANNTAELTNAFARIANEVADLRLVQ